MARIGDLLAAGRTFSFEFSPPKTTAGSMSLGRTIAELESLSPSFVSCTYGAGGSTRENTRDTVLWIERETNIPADHPLVKELDELCEHYEFESLENLDSKSLSELAGALSMFEKSCSQLRHDLFEKIDALTAALVASVRASGAGSVVKDK